MNLAFAVVILAHILADFYLQWNKMAESKEKDFNWVIYHGIEYAVVFGLVLWVCIPFSIELFYLWILAALVHFAIDGIKFLIPDEIENPKPFVPWIIGHKFILDQCLHFFTLWGFWRLCETNISVKPFIELKIDYLPAKPILIILGLLFILRPVGILIAKGELWDFSEKYKGKTEGTFEQNGGKNDKKKQNSGKMIGYLERVIVFFFLLYNQYSSIAFVLTAKSVARFKEIEQNEMKAEDYLIGTLMSMAFVFFITLFLGLTGN